MTLDPEWQTSTPGKGIVQIRHVDEGLFTSLEATNLETIESEQYRYINIEDVGCSGKVPVVFNNPNPIFAQQKIPFILIQREIEPALQRVHAGWIEYEENTDPNSEWRIQAHPFDFNYEIQVIAESRADADRILNFLLELFQVRGYITVIDSVGDTRTYDSFMESFSDNSEIGDINQRTIGYSIAFRVETELNITPAQLGKYVKTYRTRFAQKE